MMTYIKRQDRVYGKDLLKVIPKIGGSVKYLYRLEKWCECYQGKVLDSLDLWEIKMPDGKTGCFLVDALGRFACPLEKKEDVLYWLLTNEWVRKELEDDCDDEEEEV